MAEMDYGSIVGELQGRIAGLQYARSRLCMQQELLGLVQAALQGIPGSHALWKGERASEVFRSCTEGSLWGACRRAREEVGEAVRSLDAELRELSLQLKQYAAG